MEGKNEFLITREFDAPRDLVFKAWSEPERLAKWWGPKGFTINVLKLDFRAGGIFHYAMKATNSVTYGKFVYRDIQTSNRIVFVNSFADEAGHVIKPPFPEPWPTEMLNTVEFTEGDGKTELTLRIVPISATAIEHETFLKGHPSMKEGFSSTLDQLTAYLINFEFYFTPEIR